MYVNDRMKESGSYQGSMTGEECKEECERDERHSDGVERSPKVTHNGPLNSRCTTAQYHTTTSLGMPHPQ